MKNIKTIVAAITIIMGLAFFVPVASFAADGGSEAVFSGFVDASFLSEERGNSTFSLDQVEIDIEKKLSDKLSVRADINYLSGDAGTVTLTGAGAATATTDALTFDNLVEQGYLTYNLPIGEGIALSVGKFNAPIGFELLDPVDMYQFSHALVFNFGLPTNLTGIMGSTTFTDMVDLSVYFVNGWDNNIDNNDTKTAGGRLGITPIEGINIGFSVISGSNEASGVNSTNNNKTVVDVDLTVSIVENLIIGAEYNSGKDEGASVLTVGGDAKWSAYLLMAHYDFTDRYGLTARYDYFDDEDGARLGNTVMGVGVGNTRTAYTIAPTFALGDSAVMLFEYRRDESDKNVFFDGTTDSKDYTDTFAARVTYSF